MATQADREQLTGVKDDYQYGFHDWKSRFLSQSVVLITL